MKTDKKKLAKKADALWKKASLLKWGDKCVICGSPANAYHHFIPKSRSLVLRYDVENAVPLCLKHHYAVHFSSNPVEIADIVDMIRKKRGKKWCKYIEKKRKILSGGGRTINWYNEQISNLEKQCGI